MIGDCDVVDWNTGNIFLFWVRYFCSFAYLNVNFDLNIIKINPEHQVPQHSIPLFKPGREIANSNLPHYSNSNSPAKVRSRGLYGSVTAAWPGTISYISSEEERVGDERGGVMV